MLEYNDFVRCIFVDYSKAFDCVDHLLLFDFKVSNVILWLMHLVNRDRQLLTGKSISSTAQPAENIYPDRLRQLI